MPPKRAAPGGATEQAKKFRKAIDEMAEEFVCPITQELPVDPVMAEDGRVYERSAITEWLEQRPGAHAKSPATNEPMGKKLLPALQVRNTIKGMVKSGAISGAKADAWKKRIEEEDEMAEMRRKAEGGDVEAMSLIGGAYYFGNMGFPQDVKQSFAWFKKAADLDHVESLTWCGTLYMMGEGADQNSSRSLIMLGRAAALGAEHACYLLGRVHRSGRHGVGIDMQEARRWFAKMPDCSVKDSTLECRERMTAWLRENPAERF